MKRCVHNMPVYKQHTIWAQQFMFKQINLVMSFCLNPPQEGSESLK